MILSFHNMVRRVQLRAGSQSVKDFVPWPAIYFQFWKIKLKVYKPKNVCKEDCHIYKQHCNILFVLVEAGGHSADWQEIIVFDILFVFLYLQQGIFITHLLIYYIRIYIVKLLLVFMFSNILYRILLYLSYVLNLQQSYFRMHFVVLLSL